MSHFEFKLPDVGEGVVEGEVVAWHVKAGQRVREDQEMVEVMTDKATVSIGAPKAGRIVELRAEVGDVVDVGSVLVVIDTADASQAAAHGAGGAGGDTAVGAYQAPASMPPVARERARRSIERKSRERAAAQVSTSEASAASAVGDIKDELPGMQWLRAQRADAEPESTRAGKPLATPATRKLAREMDVDLRSVTPTGEGGRITAKDVRTHADNKGRGRHDRCLHRHEDGRGHPHPHDHPSGRVRYVLQLLICNCSSYE